MRKERVLHARIPEDLERELKKRSDSLGLSVSTVVRNVLMHTFDLVEGIVIDRTRLEPRTPSRRRRSSVASSSEASPVRSGETATVSDATADPTANSAPPLGWQQLTLNVNAVCEQCNALLARGTVAAVAIPIAPRPSFLCVDCVGSLGEANVDDTPKKRAPRSAAASAAKSRKSTSAVPASKRSATRRATKSAASKRPRKAD